MRAPQSIVKRPLLTEKGTRLKESGGRSERQLEGVEPEKLATKVLFEVAMDANKVEIRNAVEKLFGVHVKDVHTQIVRGKEKRIGRWIGRRSNWKKAIVTLVEGGTIDFFEGV
jgi:large subunit ribosomal protein L23